MTRFYNIHSFDIDDEYRRTLCKRVVSQAPKGVRYGLILQRIADCVLVNQASMPHFNGGTELARLASRPDVEAESRFNGILL